MTDEQLVEINIAVKISICQELYGNYSELLQFAMSWRDYNFAVALLVSY